MRGKNIYIACDLSTIGRSMSSGRIERNSSLKSYQATLLASRLSKAREKSRVDKCKWIRTIDDGHPLPGLALPVGHFVHLLRYISRGTFLGFDGRSVQQAAAATAAAAAAAPRRPADCTLFLSATYELLVVTPAITTLGMFRHDR